MLKRPSLQTLCMTNWVIELPNMGGTEGALSRLPTAGAGFALHARGYQGLERMVTNRAVKIVEDHRRLGNTTMLRRKGNREILRPA